MTDFDEASGNRRETYSNNDWKLEVKQYPHDTKTGGLNPKSQLYLASQTVIESRTPIQVEIPSYEVEQNLQKLKKRVRLFIDLLLLTAVILGAGWYFTYNSLSSIIAQETQALNTATVQLNQRTSQLNSATAQLTQKDQALNAANVQLTQKTQELNAVTAQLTQRTQELNAAKVQLAQKDQALNAVNVQLSTTQSTLDATKNQLTLYQSTYGSVVASGITAPYLRANIINQPIAVDPTWAQLQSCILADKTDQNNYVDNVYVCGDFARDVHNNAEKSGIRAACVLITFSNANIGHACNAFKTTDRGLVFIDCTGGKASDKTDFFSILFGLVPSSWDKTVVVKLGQDYRPTSLTASSSWGDMGKVTDVQVYW